MRKLNLLTLAATCLMLSTISHNVAAQKNYKITDKITAEDRFIEFTKTNIDIAISIPQLKANGEIKETTRALINKINSDACDAVAQNSTLTDLSKSETSQRVKTATPQQLEMLALRCADAAHRSSLKLKSTPEFILYSHWKTFGNKHIVSLFQQTYSYAGGAHGVTNIAINNYDLRTGKRIDINKAVIDTAYFMDKVVKYFCKTYRIKQDAMQIETGLFYELEDLPLPKQIGITNNGIVVAYNPHEIGPISIGTIIIVIPYEELGVVVNDDLRNMVSFGDSEKIAKKIKQREKKMNKL